MASESIPTEQWAQVVEKTGGRELLASSLGRNALDAMANW